MEWVDISAKTVEEAKELALDRLGVDERDAEFEIVEEPRTGIFGRSKGEARVRARVGASVTLCGARSGVGAAEQSAAFTGVAERGQYGLARWMAEFSRRVSAGKSRP